MEDKETGVMAGAEVMAKEMAEVVGGVVGEEAEEMELAEAPGREGGMEKRAGRRLRTRHLSSNSPHTEDRCRGCRSRRKCRCTQPGTGQQSRAGTAR